MISTTPFMIRAIHDWCAINNLTILLRVRCDDGLKGIPEDITRTTREIDFDITYGNVRDLMVENDKITFLTQIPPGDGVYSVEISMDSVSSIYSPKTGVGISFASTDNVAKSDRSGSKIIPLLKRVK